MERILRPWSVGCRIAHCTPYAQSSWRAPVLGLSIHPIQIMQQLPFYTTAAWRRVARLQALHDAGYQCERCGVSLVGKGQAAHVHHIKPYRRAPALATEPLNLMAVCRSCHNSEHAEMKRPRSGCDASGNPLNAEHPWFRKTGGA